jgi:hypothetical protein
MWYNRIMVGLLRSPLHSLLSGSTLVIRYQGKKSGNFYEVPVNYVRAGSRLLITSKRDRTWWRSLQGGQRVTVLLQGKNIPMQAQVITQPDSAQAGLASYLAVVPQQARYFGVGLDPEGKPLAADLPAAAQDRVVIELQFIP